MTGPVDLAAGQPVFFITQAPDELAGAFLKVLKETWRRVPTEQRQTIHRFYSAQFNGWPIVRLSPLNGAATCGTLADGYMLWFDSATILEWPRGTWTLR